MKNILILFFTVLFSCLVFGQEIEEYEFKQYPKKYTEIKHYMLLGKGEKFYWLNKLLLKEGKVIQSENFNRSGEFTSSINYEYNLEGNILKITEKDTIRNREIEYNQFVYDEEGRLIEDYYRVYSDFNNNFPQLIQPKNSIDLDSLFGYRTELRYDERGNILQRKTFRKENNLKIVDTDNYKYDIQNNLIEIKRSSEPKTNYPIHIIGGRDKYENEKFRYIYNSDNLWTKKYWIVEGDEYLIEKREFVKAVIKKK
ncbi:MAG: hypothetical protein WCY89_01040 [Flavobacteriaceae bacterium]